MRAFGFIEVPMNKGLALEAQQRVRDRFIRGGSGSRQIRGSYARDEITVEQASNIGIEVVPYHGRIQSPSPVIETEVTYFIPRVRCIR